MEKNFIGKKVLLHSDMSLIYYRIVVKQRLVQDLACSCFFLSNEVYNNGGTIVRTNDYESICLIPLQCKINDEEYININTDGNNFAIFL